jgi:hypothetical protein
MFRFPSTIALTLLLAIPLTSTALERTALIPADAQTYIRVSNVTNFLSKLKKSSAGRLWEDRQFQDFIGSPGPESWEEILFDGEKTAEDEMYIEQLKMLKGELILAFNTKNEAPHIIAALSTEDFQQSLVLDEKLAEVGEIPFRIIRDTFQDVEVIQHIEAPGTPAEDSSWQAHLNHTLVMGGSREWVEKSIVQLKKEPAEEPEGNPVLNVNLPLAEFIRDQLLEEQAAAPSPMSPDPIVLLESLGLMGIEKFTTRIELVDTEMVVDNTLAATSLHKGIFTILDFQPVELPAVGFIPENIAMIEVGRFNLLRFWQEIPAILSVAMPSAAPQFDLMLALLRQQTGIDIEQDLLAHLGTRYFAFSSVEGETLLSVTVIDLKDSQAFKHGMETAMASPALQSRIAMLIETIDFLGHSLYVSKNTAPSEAISFAVIGNYLIYGHPDALRQVIRSETSGAAPGTAFEHTELVKGMRQSVPQSAFNYSTVDWKKCMAALIHEMTKPDRVQLIQQSWATRGGPLPPPDFNKLPPADHIASFFNMTHQYIEKTGDGLHQRIILKY